MKKFILLFTALITLFTTTACIDMGDKPAILFNKNPITKENIMDYSSVFKPNVRIYYLILMPKKVHSRYIYIQIIKKDNDMERLGYKLYWANTVRLKDEEVYYYDDYIVIGQPGAYVMKVYSKDRPTEPLTMAQFFVRE